MDVRDDLAVADGVHSEADGFGGELNLVRAESQPRLYVGARKAQHGTAREIRGDRAVDVTGNESSYLGVARDYVAKCSSIGDGQK